MSDQGDDVPRPDLPGEQPGPYGDDPLGASGVPESQVPPPDPFASEPPTADTTAEIPVVGADTGPIPVTSDPAAGRPVGPDGETVGPRRARAMSAPKPHTSRYVAIACAVAALLVGAGFAFVALNNDDASSDASGSLVPVVVPTAPASLTNSLLPTESPSVVSSGTASKVAEEPDGSGKNGKKGKKGGSGTSTPKASDEASAAATRQPVVVLNSTSITGMAHRVAATITAGGWTVSKTTNWRGAQPSASTIYYQPGAENKASAQLFKKKFAVAKAIAPALPGMSGPLTLVLTSDAA